MSQMIRLDEIAISSSRKSKPFKLFTSTISAAALLGIFVGMASILVDKI